MLLRELREAKGKKLRQAAREIGVQPSQLSQWETGKKRPNDVNKGRLADFYGVTLDQLAGRAPFVPPLAATAAS